MIDPNELDDLYDWINVEDAANGIEDAEHEHKFRPLYHFTKPFDGMWRVFYCDCGEHFECPVPKPEELTWAKILGDQNG